MQNRTHHIGYKVLGFIFLQFFTLQSWAQLTVTTGQTPSQLVQNVLVGAGVTVTNVTYSGSANSIGSFTTGVTPTNLGLSSGIVMSSGVVNGWPAIGSSVSNFATTDNYLGGDADLDNLTTDFSQDAAVLAFDFIPMSDTVKFRYVFGSEEYPEYVASLYNDVFGFFISGPNPSGGSYNNKNIALIPGTAMPVCINNVHAGSYSQYYVNNEGMGGQTIVYDGFTTVFTAWALVVPCLQYHIKLAISDAGDGIYDSGVFLEANSFTATAVNVTQYPTIPAIGNDAVEGCNDVTVRFTIPQVQSSIYPVSYAISGTAGNGTDYTTIGNSVIIPAGQLYADLVIHPLMDGITEGTETIKLNIQTSICGNTQEVTVNIQDNTPLLLSASNDTSICGGSADLWAAVSGGIGPYTYEWSGGLGSAPTITVSPAATTSYTVTITDACSGTASEEVIVHSGTGNAEAGSDVSICIGQSATLTASGASNYEWSNGVNTAVNIVSPITSTTYYLTATGACTGWDSVTVFVNPYPVVTASADASSINMSESVTLTGSGGTSYTWGSDPIDYTLTNQQHDPSPTVTPVITTTYTVVGANAAGCTASASVTVQVIPVYPIINFFAIPVEGCEPLLVNFYDSTMKAAPGATYLWSFGNGTASTEINPLAFYPDNGDYEVSLTVTNPGGYGATLTKPGYIKVYPKPATSFIVLPNREISIIENPLGFFDSTISDPTRWLWSFGDGDSSRLENVFHSYADTGTYNVTLISMNLYGCSDTATTRVVIRPETAVFVPSAFTPNGDGLNDVFQIQASSIIEGSYILRIFNRYGEEIFFSTDPDYSWDGTNKGGKVLLGTYVYLIEYLDSEYHDQRKKGVVTVFR